MDSTSNTLCEPHPNLSPWPARVSPEQFCGFRVHRRDITHSTNEDAKDLGIGEAVWARQQLRGQARSGRSWESPAGNLYLSVKLAGKDTLAESAMLSLVAGLAISDAARAVLKETEADIRIKWPNDVLVNDHKLSGILLEAEHRAGRIDVIVGMGLNVATHPDSLDRPCTSLAAQLGHRNDAALDLHNVLRLCLTGLEHWDAIWRQHDGPERISEAFCARAWGRNHMTVKIGDTIESGQFLGLGAHGSLRLLTSDGAKTFSSGEIIFGITKPNNTFDTPSGSDRPHAAAH